MAIFEPEKNVKLNYQVHGDGEKAIIFLNGLTMSTKGWKNQIKYFKDKFKVVVYDMRGQGLSTKPEEKFHFTDQVSDLKKLMQHLNIEKAYLAGVSYGTIILKEFAIQHPEMCEKIILMSPVRKPDFAFEMVLKILDDLLINDRMETFYAFLLYASFNRPFSDKIKPEYPIMNELFIKTLPAKSTYNLFHSVDFYNDLDNYPELEVPTLVLGAINDRFVNPEDAVTISKEAKNAQVKMIEGSHALPGVNPTDVNNEIEKFFS